MNDALMQMKSRHKIINTYLTGIARRALLLFTLLLCVCGSAWGQIANVSTGTVDSQNYGWFMSSYPNSQTVPDLGSWSGYMESFEGPEHWNGSGVYYEQLHNPNDWGADSWDR